MHLEAVRLVLKKLTTDQTLVERDTTRTYVAEPPSTVIDTAGRMALRILALRLVGLTALTDPNEVEAIRTAAVAITTPDDQDWTQADALTLLNAVGSMPVPARLRIQRLEGQGILLLRVPAVGDSRGRAVTYPKGSLRAQVRVQGDLRDLSIKIPEKMVLECPAKLVEDEKGLALAIYLRRGTVRHVVEVERKESQNEETQGK
jgi:hypothetical protein